MNDLISEIALFERMVPQPNGRHAFEQAIARGEFWLDSDMDDLRTLLEATDSDEVLRASYCLSFLTYVEVLSIFPKLLRAIAGDGPRAGGLVQSLLSYFGFSPRVGLTSGLLPEVSRSTDSSEFPMQMQMLETVRRARLKARAERHGIIRTLSREQRILLATICLGLSLKLISVGGQPIRIFRRWCDAVMPPIFGSN